VKQAVSRIALRIHQDILLSSNMLVEPKDTVLVLPARTRYEQRGGGTETSTERRVIFSPEIAGPRLPETKDEWEIPVLVARRAHPGSAEKFFPWRDAQNIREEIDHVCPTYSGIGQLRQKGDNFQYGGPHLLGERFLTSDGKGHFSAIALPGEEIRPGRFLLSTRSGKQFNSMILAVSDPLTGLARDEIILSRTDAQRLGVCDGDSILLRGQGGEFTGRVRIDRIKPGNVQGHWPEVNVVLPAGCLDESGVPDYNGLVEIIPLKRSRQAAG
jgi:predicted molibdopterin-dependent oxidoreductase YjgC